MSFFTQRDIDQVYKSQLGRGRVTVRGVTEAGMVIRDLEEEIVRETNITTFSATKKLWRESQKRVPYDTGDLMRSGKYRRVPRTRGLHEPERWEVYYGELGIPWYTRLVHDNAWNPPLGPESFNRPRREGQTPRPYPETPKGPFFLTGPAEQMTKDGTLHQETTQAVKQAIKNVVAHAPTAALPRLVKKRV